MVATLDRPVSTVSQKDHIINATTVNITSTFSATIAEDYTVEVQYRPTLRSQIETIQLTSAVHPILSALLELAHLKNQYMAFVEQHQMVLDEPTDMPTRIELERGRYTIRLKERTVTAIDKNGVQWMSRKDLIIPQFWDALIWQLHTHRQLVAATKRIG